MTEEYRKLYDKLRVQVSIHPQALHKDAQAQPDLVSRAGELAAELKTDARRAKMEADEVKARISRAVRLNPQDYGIEKATAPQIEDAATIDPEVMEANRAYLDAQHESGIADSLVEAFQHRKSMIVEEVKLYLNNYYSEVEVKEMDDAKTDVVVDGESKVNENRKRRRRRRKEE